MSIFLQCSAVVLQPCTNNSPHLFNECSGVFIKLFAIYEAYDGMTGGGYFW